MLDWLKILQINPDLMKCDYIKYLITSLLPLFLIPIFMSICIDHEKKDFFFHIEWFYDKIIDLDMTVENSLYIFNSNLF